MALVLGFDVYGTLVDPWSISRHLAPLVGEQEASRAAELWRSKQIEYSFRRGLMEAYADFDTCTRHALLHTLATAGVRPTPVQVDDLLTAYLRLPAYDDVAGGLTAFRAQNARMLAFSNGTAASVREVLENAALLGLFDDVVSVDEVSTFKPDPVVYRHLVARGGAQATDTWVVSANAWDVIGAKSAGLRAIWIKRGDVAFDPWGIESDFVAESLPDAASILHTEISMEPLVPSEPLSR